MVLECGNQQQRTVQQTAQVLRVAKATKTTLYNFAMKSNLLFKYSIVLIQISQQQNCLKTTGWKIESIPKHRQCVLP